MSIRQSIANRLKQARMDAGYKTARSFARAHDIPQPTYATHESGERGLKPERAAFYADLLNVSTAWLLTGEAESGSGNRQGIPLIIRIGTAGSRIRLDIPETERETLPLPPRASLDPQRCFVAELAQDHAHWDYRRGDLLYCERVCDGQAIIRAGDLCLLRRYLTNHKTGDLHEVALMRCAEIYQGRLILICPTRLAAKEPDLIIDLTSDKAGLREAAAPLPVSPSEIQDGIRLHHPDRDNARDLIIGIVRARVSLF